MNQDKTIELFKKGKEAWNAWAEGMLARRKELEEAGEWNSRRSELGRETGGNDVARQWFNDATADFSRLQLPRMDQLPSGKDKDALPGDEVRSGTGEAELVNFGGWIFPSTAKFSAARFSGPAYFGEAAFSGIANFSDAMFGGDASFIEATFSGTADFIHANFSGDAYFSDAVFNGDAFFLDARFSGGADFRVKTFSRPAVFRKVIFSSDADFRAVTFSSDAVFQDAKFTGAADFQDAKFGGAAGFQDAKFSGAADFRYAKFTGAVLFSLCEFEKPVDWRKASFAESVSFGSIRSQRSFSLRQVEFNQAPDFLEAEFNVPPVVDDMKILFPVRFRFDAKGDGDRDVNGNVVERKNCAVTPDDHRYMRALRKLADDGGDHLQSMNFFADEIRARRHWVDLPGGPGMARYYFGWAYQIFSDFGRSIARPFVGWAATTGLFAFLYYWLSTGAEDSGRAAIYLSVRHALVVGGLVRNKMLDGALSDLLGDQIHYGAAGAMVLQSFVSAVFLFFIALALRNHFKIGR